MVDELCRLGHDVLNALAAGNANQEIPDDEVLAFACAAGRAVLTINRRDFIRQHRQQPNHTGIIVCTADLDFIGQVQRIHTAIEAANSLVNQLIRVNRPARVN